MTETMMASVRAELERIAEERGLTPAVVVAQARDPASPLHPHFTWDDSAAARLQRLEEARRLIRKVKVTISTPKGDIRVRAFVSVIRERDDPHAPGRRGYVPTEEALGSVNLREQLIADALRDLEVWRLRYNNLSELAAIFAAIEEVRRRAA